MKRRSILALGLLVVTLAANAFAATPDKDGWYHTGDAVRVKSIAFISVKVYGIGHDMKCVPASKSKQAVIEADCDKRFVWTMKRDVDRQKIIDALKEAYAMNGYTDGGKIGQAVGAFTAELKEGKRVTVSYDAAKKTTTFSEEGGGTASIVGADFMKGTWSIWLGKIDPPSLGDALIANL
jgi:hypothetical protein